MPMHSDRKRRARARGRYSERDCLAEYLREPADDDEAYRSGDATDLWSEDPYDDWRPVRRRRRRASDRP